MKYFIYPYKSGSKSAKALRNALGGKLIKLENSGYRLRDDHIVINYGNSQIPTWLNRSIINMPAKVREAANKLSTFNVLSTEGVPTVEYTESKDTAVGWVRGGHKVYARSVLSGHSGEGIVVVGDSDCDKRETLEGIVTTLRTNGFDYLADLTEDFRRDVFEDVYLPNVPLYTKGVENNGEYRVHVAFGNVILYQKKSRRFLDDNNVDEPNEEQSDVRNLESGWVYRTGNLRRLERVERLAVDAISALGLDFGAVDIIMDNGGDVFVLEVNTAPGLGNTQTLEAYVNAFRALE